MVSVVAAVVRVRVVVDLVRPMFSDVLAEQVRLTPEEEVDEDHVLNGGSSLAVPVSFDKSQKFPEAPESLAGPHAVRHETTGAVPWVPCLPG